MRSNKNDDQLEKLIYERTNGVDAVVCFIPMNCRMFKLCCRLPFASELLCDDDGSLCRLQETIVTGEHRSVVFHHKSNDRK